MGRTHHDPADSAAGVGQMTRLTVAAGLGLWLGLTMLLSATQWGKRLTLAERLRPHAPGNPSRGTGGLLSTESALHSLGPLATMIGTQISQALGTHEDLSVRLRRVHAPMDATTFRLRQVGIAAAGLGISIGAALMLPIPPTMVAALLLGTPLGAFCAIEQQLSAQSKKWQRRLFLEAPIIADQIAMHLSAGASLSNALTRTTNRGSGAITTDLRDVLLRIRQGLTEREALEEWADVANVPAIRRLVAVLSLHGEAGDLERIVSDEATALRREVHRELISSIESRNQQVWIPVTVSALIPGVIVLAVPFFAAIHSFSQ
jgi:tight adherence protein C